MKKEDFTSLLVYLVMIGVAVIFGFAVLKTFGETCGMAQGKYIGYLILAIVVGVLGNSILYEVGHIIGALIGGYTVRSINILYMCLYKRDAKWKFRFANFEGLTGETKIGLKKDKKKSNPILFNIFPTLLFMIEFAVCISLFIILNKQTGGNNTLKQAHVAYFLLIITVIGFMILFYNIIPIKLDTVNDGYRLFLLANPKNKEAFNELLRVSEAIDNGEKDVEVKTFDTITNFTAELNYNKVYLLLNQDKLNEAEVLIDNVITNKDNISPTVLLRAEAQKLYIVMMTKDLKEAHKYYKDNYSIQDSKKLSDDVSMESIRAYILVSGLLDKSKSEVERSLAKVMKAFKRTNKNRQIDELKLYNKALKRVIDAHPSWNLEGYLLEEKN